MLAVASVEPELMSRIAALVLFASIACSSAGAGPTLSPSDPGAFLERFSGEWRGTGRVLIGRDSGLKFHCALEGEPSRTKLTFAMKGKCWAGKLSALVHASLRYNADNDRFYGDFMDGAEGQGADIVGERAGEGFFLKISRGAAQGRVFAEPVGGNQMKVILSLHDRATKRDIPVAAMGFAKGDAASLPLYDPRAEGAAAAER